MPYLDRPGFITLLNQLGSPEDAEALAAARELDRRVRTAGVEWDDLLAPADAPADIDDDIGPEDEPADADADVNAEVVVPAEPDTSPLPQGSQDDLVLIDRILAKKSIGENTREELLGLKQDIADGTFTAMDRKYLRSLNARLSGR